MLVKPHMNKHRKKLIIYIALAVVILAVFWQVNQFDFVNLDDNVYVTENSAIKAGMSFDGFRWAFVTKYFGLWNPLVWLSFMLDYQLYGLHPGGYHVTNLILHILSTLLLFWLFHRMTHEIWKSAFVAAFFALHPLHVESVAWISERKDVLSAFFWMLTLCCYVYYTEKPMIKRYLLVLFSFVLALMSKPMVITLPVIMMLLDYWPLKRFPSRKSNVVLWQLKEKSPFFFLSLILVFITFYTPGNNVSYQLLPLEVRLANAPVAFITYLIKTFWPHDMAIFYPFRAYIPTWQVFGALISIIVISAIVIVMAKRLSCCFVGWLWFVTALLPVIKIVQVGHDAMADRYHYLPSIGIAMILAWGIPLLFQSEDTRKKILLPPAIALLIIFSILTWKQCGYWRNSIELWHHALIAIKDNVIAHNQLGLALFEKGKTNEAIGHFNQAIRISPNYFLSYQNKGNLYNKMGQYTIAISHYNESIRLLPNNAESFYGRGSSYIKLGQYQSALEDFDKTIRLKPDYAEAYNNRAFVSLNLGQYQKALEDYNKAILIKPGYTDAYNNRAFVYFSTGDIASGCHDAKKACQMGTCATWQLATAKELCR